MGNFDLQTSDSMTLDYLIVDVMSMRTFIFIQNLQYELQDLLGVVRGPNCPFLCLINSYEFLSSSAFPTISNFLNSVKNVNELFLNLSLTLPSYGEI